MSQSLRRIIDLEAQYDGPPPPCSLRWAIIGGDAYEHRRRNADDRFLSAEAVKAVHAIAQLRSRTLAPKADARLGVLAGDLHAIRAKAAQRP
ncbi:MAG: hypothetical protein HOM25_10995 [Rhodospirillaceae bacterium]|jgi:hypothetical protein|nr:hypothetical protein [Rhodospirillaceae bacterium]MBT5666435.1 hypothetical protein [Rhodospirillaceae bacterium]MBT5811912.1 hypothetical protein [Rhodospirillaceae bacterium]